MKLENYLNLLYSIYEKRIVDKLTERVSNTKIRLKEDKDKLNDIIKNYKRGNELCDDCIELYKNFFDRRIDFPSWKEFLDFNLEHIKDIMIIGQDPSPKIQTKINIAYELGRFPIKPNGEVDTNLEVDKNIKEQIKKNKLWVYLNQLFCNQQFNLEKFLKRVYITDISKCNAEREKKNKNYRKIWNRCSSNYLLKEIKYINPKVLLFQGNIAFLKTMALLKREKWLVTPINIKHYFSQAKIPKFGIISFNSHKIFYLKIYHSAYFFRWMSEEKREIYLKEYSSLIKEKIYPLIQ